MLQVQFFFTIILIFFFINIVFKNKTLELTKLNFMYYIYKYIYIHTY